MQILPSSSCCVRIAAIAGLFAALIVLAPLTAKAAEPGEVLHTFSLPAGSAGSYRSYWAFDDTLGRHYFIRFSPRAFIVTDRGGSIVRIWDMSESENWSDFAASLGTFNFGELFFVGESTIYTFASDLITMKVWRLVNVGEGKGELELLETLDFSDVLSPGCANAIDRADDGSWWVLCSNTIYNINPQGTSIRRSITSEELGERLAGTARTVTLLPTLLAVDRISGDLYVNAGFVPGGNNYVYRLDGESLLQKGRFSGLGVGIQQTGGGLIGARDGFAFMGNGFVSQLALEPQNLPDVTSISFDQEGVMWTYCPSVAARNIVATFGVNWGDADAGQVYETGLGIMGGSAVSPEPTISFRRSQLDAYPPFPETIIVLRGSNDQLSTPITVSLPLAPYAGPVMFMPVCSFAVGETINQKNVTWSWGGVAPKEPFNAWVRFEEYVPIVGDKTYGIKDVQATGAATISSKDDGSVAIAGGGEFLLGPGKLRTEFGGGVLQKLTVEGPEVTGGLLTAKVAGSVSQEAGLLKAFPALEVIRSVPLLRSALAWLDKRAKLTATITVGLDSSTKIKLSDENDILFEGELTAFLALGVAAAVKLINGYAEVTAYGEGKGSATFTPSSEGLALKQFTITALIGAKIRAYLLERKVERVITFSASDGITTSKRLPNDGLVYDSGWQYAYGADLTRGVPKSATMPYVITPNPFDEFAKHTRASIRVTGSQSFDREAKVLGGIPADATLNSATSSIDNTMMVVWSQPIPGNPATQATDVWFSYFDGRIFSNPAPVYTDDRADFNPKVQFHRNTTFGQHACWVAVWERSGIAGMMPTGDPEADTNTILANMRPVWSWFDPQTRVWSEPEEFPIEGANGFNVQLMHSGTGWRAGVAWLESDTGSLVPWDLGAASPSSARVANIRLRYAQLFRPLPGGNLEPVVQIIGDIRTLGDEDPDNEIPTDIVEYSAGMDMRIGGATEIIILATRMTGVMPGNPLQPVMRLDSWGAPGFAFVGGTEMKLRSWEEDIPTTSNPQVRITQNTRTTGIVNGPRLLIGQHQSGGGTPPLPGLVISPGYEEVEFEPDDPGIPEGAGFHSYKLAELPYPPGDSPGITHNPPRATVLHKPDERGNLKLHLAGTTRKIGPITHGSDTDRHATVTLASDGTLLTMYQKVPIRRTPVTRKVGRQEEELVLIEEEDTGFFAVSRRIIATDLMAGEVRHRSGFFLPGHEILLEAEVHNVGDIPVTGARMSLYAVPEGTKQVELIPIMENELIMPFSFSSFSGNDTAVKEVVWTVPDEREYSFVILVDPDNEIDEFDESNNVGESFIAAGAPSDVAQWLLGRLAGEPTGLDRNEDDRIDAADVLF